MLSGTIDPEHRPVTIAFLHYGEFDRLVREGPADAADVLDELVRSVQRVADSHGVTFLATDIAPDGGKIILTAGCTDHHGSNEEQMLLALRRSELRPRGPARSASGSTRDTSSRARWAPATAGPTPSWATR